MTQIMTRHRRRRTESEGEERRIEERKSVRRGRNAGDESEEGEEESTRGSSKRETRSERDHSGDGVRTTRRRNALRLA